MAVKYAQHGHTSGGKVSPTYIVWNGMIARCQNPKSISYPNYGAVGITVCPEWQVFAGFLADMGDRPPGLSLDRKDSSLGYYLGNCHWIPRSEQNKEKRKPIEFMGMSMSLPEWAEYLGIKRSTLAQRIYVYKWPLAQALQGGNYIGGQGKN